MIGLLTLVGFPIIGFVVHLLLGKGDFMDMFSLEYPLWVQITTGLVFGAFAGLFSREVVASKFMEKSRYKYAKAFSQFNLSWVQIIFLSLCAGIGEEIFFRGVLQPLLGIVITSFLFVAVHGYLNPMNWRLMIYGLIMTFFIVGIGVMHERMGVVAPILAHAMIDVVLLKSLSDWKSEV